MLTVTTAAATSRLATLEAVKAELEITGTAQDTHLETLLDQASAAIASHCSRVFGREVLSETLRLSRHLDAIVLGRVPVVSIASVTEDGGALVADDDYECDLASGLLYRLSGDRQVRWCARKVVIAYTAGWLLPEDTGTTLPTDVARACVLTVSAWYAAQGRDPMLRSDSDQNIGSTSWIATADMGGLPPQVEALLDAGGYRLYAVG